MALAKTLMVQGTASNVGKSVMTAAFCRILKRQGYRVAPFKAQNMANNSFVTREGGEIGRAQAMQAEACDVEASVLMNPILLKPDTDLKAQVVALGKPVSRISSIGQRSYHKRFKPVVFDALRSLQKKYDVVVIEGAGSPAEINLKKFDIVNMSIARFAKSPVVLVGDIDWGGIFAQLIGTFQLLAPEERKLIKAFLINKFRGDLKILKPGVRRIEEITKRPVLGVLPFLSDMDIAEEDSISGAGSDSSSGLRANARLDAISGKSRDRRRLRGSQKELLIDILWLPRISNFTDFDPLQREQDVCLRYLHEPDRHALPDLIILPGTKSTIADFEFLKRSGLADYLLRAVNFGTPILGICGGYQMLGERIEDAHGMESRKTRVKGLGLLPMVTQYKTSKTTVRVEGVHLKTGTRVQGYEIHMGHSQAKRKMKPFIKIDKRDSNECRPEAEGMVRSLGHGRSWIAGTYLHGLFDAPIFLQAFLNGLRDRAGLSTEMSSVKQSRQNVYDRLADDVESHINMKLLKKIVQLP